MRKQFSYAYFDSLSIMIKSTFRHFENRKYFIFVSFLCLAYISNLEKKERELSEKTASFDDDWNFWLAIL